MPIRIVQSKQNPRLKQLRRALAKPLGDAEAGGRMLAGIEGPNLLKEAVRAGLHIECVFVAEGSERLLDGLALPAQTDILVTPAGLLDASLATETPQAVAALVETPDWTWAQVLDPARKDHALVVVLAGLQDPGNLGAVLRSAEAFGADGVLSLPGTANAWNPKAVRASAGSVFRLPVLEASAELAIERLHEAGVKVWTTRTYGALRADLADLAGATALLIGNEGNGVPPDLAARSDGALTIACPGRVESLNASVAAGVLLYEAARQRNVEGGFDLSHKNKNVARVGHREQARFPADGVEEER
ncbi:MAG TPA: RNA methyltransferase [Terracidiphilus sp.]|jgi:TrmH family RNA methyltransferase